MNPDETPNTDRESYEKRIRELEKELERYKAYFEFVRSTGLEQRNALSPIIGFSHLLLETTTLTEEQTDYVESLLYLGAYPLLHKNNRFVDVNHRMAKTLEAYSGSFDIRRSLNQIIQDLSHLAVKRKTTLSLEVAPQIAAFVEADESRVRQILYDLVEFSIGYTPRHVETFVKLAQVETLTFLHFSITNTASQLSPKFLTDMLEFFAAPTFQIELLPSYRLEIVRAKLLCDLLQGKIWVENQGEQGTGFHFTIPYVPSVGDGH